MSRRVNLPGADELFRPTTPRSVQQASHESPQADTSRGNSGRVKHDEKMTIYLTSDELMALEQARLELRSMLGRKVDRGMVVRAALSGALEGLARQGTDSELFGRLRD